MKQNEKQITEEAILGIVNESLKKWEAKFKTISISIDIPVIHRNNSELDYFSEIEFNFWREGNLISPCSIIIYMDNKQVLEISKARKFIQEEIEISYKECSSDCTLVDMS